MELAFPPWMAEGPGRELFMQFPLALAVVVAPGAKPVCNTRFRELLHPSALGSDPLRSLLSDPGTLWKRASLRNRRGESVEARVQALTMEGGIMLVVDDTPEAQAGEQVQALRARVTELEQLSATDPLTGAWNRAHMEHVMAAEISRSLRLRQPVSLVVIDLDHFKRINDTHGHPAGDAVLVEFVRLMKSRVRVSDHVFRWGGEEFVVLAPTTGYRSAAGLAESLRAAVQAHVFPAAGSVTASIGVAEHRDKESAGEWFARADVALYSAKNGGRNRVVVDRQGNSDSWQAEHGLSALQLTWLESYECGLPEIDAQHEELFRRGNSVIDASIAGDGEKLNEAIGAMFGALETHFRDELALLERVGYPRREEHAAEHARLMAHARDLRKRAAADPKILGDLVEFLAGEVVAGHILSSDRDFFPMLGPR